ncbi:rod shape-determining protein RodA [Megasphaera cerevisiae DSM 20462]|jgi:rod shape determining protein RodA|uniref:Peptidoglycan glycosyltransferase RodA n=1 Tax=Megasphaera cerevisiae DSM 20462 TaxID=1122219 RepID=A0A0J6WWF1_9FIRM|nr:rod shape-determining protein RodA [Megasphaera cerevisiae]KMO87860.1 rod shape-determining protein RodA [Megasphaera cerevisiae DSM 20462]MCI1750136.1 rod shape-determining protein RodA [Megasphaera cerevisiae]OKY54352.1 rod shape-determining protein RodA [Megasphaera cerevisiae]SJZ42143.1 rod shape determining protein RodA [Megasphaera cerevisiae DSM 20462]
MLKREWKNLDKFMIIVCVLIVFISLCIIGSATHINKGVINYDFVAKQGVAFIVDFMIVLFFSRYDYMKLKRFAKPLYTVNLLMLAAVMFVGTSALGAQRWIQLGPITLQPSEFSKLIMIVCLAGILSDKVGKLDTIKSILPIGLFIGIPFLLVLKQPDLGTSLVFLAIGLGMLFIARIKGTLLRNFFAIGVILAPIGWHFLKDYQKARISVFLNPNADPFGAGYHIIQSKIAIGSGMLFGKGLFEGTQSQLNFLPENHTDFIFSVIGEELGFLGCIFLLFLYFILVYRALIIARECKDNFGRLLATGIVSMWSFQILVNVGMTCGIMPVTGIPLPFMSYGVSALTTNMMALGILLSIYMRQQTMIF